MFSRNTGSYMIFMILIFFPFPMDDCVGVMRRVCFSPTKTRYPVHAVDYFTWLFFFSPLQLVFILRVEIKNICCSGRGTACLVVKPCPILLDSNAIDLFFSFFLSFLSLCLEKPSPPTRLLNTTLPFHSSLTKHMHGMNRSG